MRSLQKSRTHFDLRIISTTPSADLGTPVAVLANTVRAARRDLSKVRPAHYLSTVPEQEDTYANRVTPLDGALPRSAIPRTHPR